MSGLLFACFCLRHNLTVWLRWPRTHCVDHTGLKLTGSACLPMKSSEIKSMHHHDQQNEWIYCNLRYRNLNRKLQSSWSYQVKIVGRSEGSRGTILLKLKESFLDLLISVTNTNFLYFGTSDLFNVAWMTWALPMSYISSHFNSSIKLLRLAFNLKIFFQFTV